MLWRSILNNAKFIMEVGAHFEEGQYFFSSQAKKIVLSDSPEVGQKKLFVVIYDKTNKNELFVLELVSEYMGAIFRGLLVWHNFIIIACERRVYLFNFLTEKTLVHPLKSYFNNFFSNNNYLMVCSATNMNCFDKTGRFLWRSEKLGTEHVVVNNVTSNAVLGSGEWGSTGEWKNFIIDLKTGMFFPKRENKKGIIEKLMHWRKLKKAKRI